MVDRFFYVVAAFILSLAIQNRFVYVSIYNICQLSQSIEILGSIQKGTIESMIKIIKPPSLVYLAIMVVYNQSEWNVIE